MGVNLAMLGLGLGLVAMSLVALLVLVRRMRRVVEEPAAAAVDLSIYAVVGEPGAHTAVLDDEPVADVRALRAQVRVLEEALERAAEATVEQPELASYRAQVRIAVEAVARRTPVDTDPRLAVSRVAAAVARLDADPTERVTLPAPRRRPVSVAPVAPVVPEPLPQPELRVEEQPADAVETVAPVVDEPVGADEVVLPVPPPAPAETRRSRRRSKRSAA